MNPRSPVQTEIRARLEELTSQLVEQIESTQTGIQEGVVMTMSRPPYRRLDCEGRALAYVRVRPTKQWVRVDISDLWFPPSSDPLIVREEADIPGVVQSLLSVVASWRNPDALASNGA